ncbi:MAG: anti-sigma factor antagonist [Eubacterium sp.]|nr:anti-sigma factor antagonist [Eubacterium sp.]
MDEELNNMKTYALKGKINAENAAAVEESINAALSGSDTFCEELVFDASNLEYISSAGLRVILRIAKKYQGSLGESPVKVINVSPEVYDIFQVTGFTDILDVEKKLREVKPEIIDGLQLLGKGANGSVYRLDEERIIKVYNPVTGSLNRINREKEAAKQAFIHDIPTAISYDVVRVKDKSSDSSDGRYGIIYEMINASTLGQYIMAGSDDNGESVMDRIDKYAVKMADLLKKLHSTEFEPGILPDAREGLFTWVDIAENSGFYTNELISAMREEVEAIPERSTFIHGDFHPGNLMVVDGELVLIDMTDASVGDPLIDLLGSYQIMKLIAMKRPEGGIRYTGIPNDLLMRLWNIFIRSYTGITDEGEMRDYERKLGHYALIRSIAGITFSDLVPEKELSRLTKEVSEAYLRYDRQSL